MFLFIGLGNPGTKYELTRHNVGFMLIDFLQKKFLAPPWRLQKKWNAWTSEANINGKKVIFAKPSTYMNDSGKAVHILSSFYKMGNEETIIFHDEMDLPLGKYKISQGRGPAGHKGIISIMESLGTKDFIRVRVGIHPKASDNKVQAGDIVLKRFTIREKKELQGVFEQVSEEIKKKTSEQTRPLMSSERY
jgi:PTH1 family peptidyl-tRNA hydrolase